MKMVKFPVQWGCWDVSVWVRCAFNSFRTHLLDPPPLRPNTNLQISAPVPQ